MNKINLLPEKIQLNNKDTRLKITRVILTDSNTLEEQLYWSITYNRLDKKNCITEVDVDFQIAVKKMLIFLIKKDLI